MTKLKKANMKNQKGYTVTELLIVILFIAMLIAAGFIVYAVIHFVGKFW